MSVQFAPRDLVAGPGQGPRDTHPPYTVLASTEFGSPLVAAAAFDNSNTNFWVGTGGGVDWLRVQILSGDTEILESYAIKMGPTSARGPKNFTLEGSNDGSSWTTVDTRTNETGWSANETRTWTCATQTTAYAYFRVNITANNGDATYTEINEFYLYTDSDIPTDLAPHNMTTNSAPSPYVASASTEAGAALAYKAFDGVVGVGNQWIGNNSGVDWLRIDLGAGQDRILQAYTIVGPENNGRSPKTWTFEGSPDGTSWTTVDTRTNEPAWAALGFERRTFICATQTDAYRYYRINITANYSSVETSIAELYLWRGAVGGGGGGGGLFRRSLSSLGTRTGTRQTVN